MPERLPRKNDPASIDARREALGLDGVVTAADLAPYLRAAESVTGTAVLPVSVAQLLVSLGVEPRVAAASRDVLAGLARGDA